MNDAPQNTTPEHILQFFSHEHLPADLAAISRPFCELARKIALGSSSVDGDITENWPLPRNPERTVALRKLLEAKDASVRAYIAK